MNSFKDSKQLFCFCVLVAHKGTKENLKDEKETVQQ
jgi:hypothetical protein